MAKQEARTELSTRRGPDGWEHWVAVIVRDSAMEQSLL